MHNASYSASVNGNQCLANATLAKGTTTTISTGAAIDFEINGLLYTKAAAANFAPTACASQAAGTSCMYLITVVAAGTVTVTKGTEQVIGSSNALNWPAIPANSAVIGAFKLVNVTNPFICGTTALDATGCTATFYNYRALPSFVLTA